MYYEDFFNLVLVCNEKNSYNLRPKSSSYYSEMDTSKIVQFRIRPRTSDAPYKLSDLVYEG